MGNLKQRLIKPGRDYNYAEGVKVKASSAVYADQIVCVDGSEGVYLTVVPADADGGVASTGRLMIAKHDIPANGYGVVLPWKLVTTVATDGAGVALGDAVYLNDTVTDGVAGNLTLTAPTADTQIVILGRVTKLAAAGTGSILVHADAPELRVHGGPYTATNAAAQGCAMEQLRVTTGANTDNIDLTLDYPVIVTDVHAISAGSETDNAICINGTGANAICTAFAFGGADGTVTRAALISRTHCSVAAGTPIRVRKSGNGDAGDLIIVTFIRA